MRQMRWFTRLSLKNKIVVSFLAVVLAVSLAIALLTRSILLASLNAELEERGLGVAWSVAERSAPYILDRNRPELLSLVYHEATSGKRKLLIDYIYILSNDGQILSHTFVTPVPDDLKALNPLPPGQDFSVRKLIFDDNPVLDVAVPVSEGLHRLGEVHAGVRQDRIYGLVDKLRMTFMAYISAIILLVFLISDRFSRSITRPLSRLTRISDDLSKGNFDIPIDVTGTGDLPGATGCPAYLDDDVHCTLYEHVLSTAEHGLATDVPPQKGICDHCVFLQEKGGDEVEQLASSFRNMVWSIKLYRKRLRESEIKYRSLFDSGPEPIVVMDARTLEIIDANPGAEELYCFTREELLGRSFSELDKDGMVDVTSPKLSGSEDTPTTIFISKAVQYAKGGVPFYANISASPIIYGGRKALVVSVADITEIMEMDAQLIQAGKMKSLGEMSAGIAHEVNQPLNAIKMGSEYLLLISEDPDLNVSRRDYREALKEISAQVDRAAEIIRTLRSFGRKGDHDRVSVDINTSVNSVLTMVRKQMELDNIDFRVDLQNDLPRIKAQDNQLQQVFFNLLSNARDAVIENGEKDKEAERRIEVRSRFRVDHVVVEVEDTGGGIPENARDKVFEPFFTTKEAGQGMGLGLSIIYGIVKDNGGTIQVVRSSEKGTLFSVSFPPIVN